MSISAVSAADATEKDIISANNNEKLILDENINDDLSNTNNNYDNELILKNINGNSNTKNEENINASDNNRIATVKSDLKLSDSDTATFSSLATEISPGGYIELAHAYYTYNNGASTININTEGTVINGKGAVIDMAGSNNILPFSVNAARVTFINLTIKNANHVGYGGAIYFSENAPSGNVTNCNFTSNTAMYGGCRGGAISMESGNIENCNFTDNHATGTNSKGGAVYIRSSGDVTNCNFNNNHATGDYSYGGAIRMDSGNVTNCNFTDNHATGRLSCGGAIYIDKGGDVRLSNFINNTASAGGALHQANAYYCTFTENRADGGGAMYEGIADNCKFTGNIAAEKGGAIYFEGDGTVTNCNFTDNHATGDDSFGGAIYMGSGSVTNCNFTNNIASGKGGAVYISNSGNVTNCNFTINTASSQGGAIYIISGSVTNCNFTNNTANDGGAIYIWTTGNVTNCNFTINTASSQGGAIYIISGSVTNCNFTNNIASGEGGAVYIWNTGDVKNCNFTNNNATYGGAIYIWTTSNVTNCNFTNNTASEDGGAIWMSYGSVENCNFTDNHATGDYSWGGAIRMNSGSVTNCNFTNNTANDGGAIHMGLGNVTNCNFTDNKATGEDSKGGAVYISSSVNVTNCNFTGNNATTGSAIYFSDWDDSLSVSNSTFLNNRADAEDLEIERNDDKIKITFKGKDNLINAIYSNNEGVLDFSNVTYWYVNGTANTDEFPAAPSNNETGQNITIVVVVNDILLLNTTKVTDENGQILLDMIVGEYKITARHDADSYYTEKETSKTFTNEGTETSLNLEVLDNTVTARINTTSATGNVTFSVENGSDIVRTLETPLDGDIAELDLSGLALGEYNITASYGGSLEYYPSIANITFEKVLLDSTILIEVSNITTDENEIINITVNEAKDKNVTVHVNDDEYNITEGTLSLTLAEGIYYITAFWAGDNDYKNCSNSSKFWAIENKEYYVNITPVSTNNRTVNITANSNIKNEIIEGQLIFILPNSTEISANYNPEGIWWAIYTFDKPGDYNITASYDVLEDVTINNATITIIADVPIYLSDINISYGEPANIVVFVPETINGQNITVTVNGSSKNATVKEGQAKATFTGLHAYEHTILAEYLGDGYYPANSTTSKLTVNKVNSTIILENITLDYGESINLTVITEGATGITAKIDDTDAVVDGYVILIPSLNAGNHTITVSTIADNNHNPVTETANLTVNKVNSTISLKNIALNYGETLNLTVITEGATGITAKIDDTDAVVDGYVILIPSLNAGNHTITVSTIADNNHNPVTETANLTVNKVSSTLTVPNIVFDYNSTGSTKVSFTGATGIEAEVANQTDAVIVIDNDKITVSNLNGGQYTLIVTTIPDENHNSKTRRAVITVNKLNTEINATDMNVSLRSDESLVASLKDSKSNPIVGATLSVDLNGTKTYTTDSNGEIKVPLNELDPNKYIAKIKFKGNENYAKSEISVNVIINKISTQLNATDINTSYNVNKDLIVTLKDSEGNLLSGFKVSIDLNGKKDYTTDSNGQVKVATKGLTPDSYKAIIIFAGDENYTGTNTSASVTIKRGATAFNYTDMNTIAFDSNIEGRVGEYFQFQLLDENGKPLSGKQVFIGFNGVKYNRTTNETGEARLQINLKYANHYTFAIAFLGDDNYSGSFNVALISVTEQTPSLSTSAKTYKASAKTKVLTATLKSSRGQPIAGKKITFTLNGKIYSGNTNSEGMATVKVSLSKKGTYSFTAQYGGDSTYKKVTKSSKLTIK